MKTLTVPSDHTGKSAALPLEKQKHTEEDIYLAVHETFNEFKTFCFDFRP